MGFGALHSLVMLCAASLALVMLFGRAADGQNLGCLISRLDLVNCTFRNPQSTNVPGPNYYGIYQTKFKKGSAGFPVCDILRKDHKVLKIESIGVSSKVYVLYSPGITLESPERYGNQQYVKYKVQCPDNQLAFFNVTRLDMEPANCFDPTKNAIRCVDYVTVQREGYGDTESCGQEASGNMEQLEFGSFDVILRTSAKKRFPGFIISVICFDPNSRDQPDCTRPEGSDEMIDMGTSSGKRRRRDLEAFHDLWRRKAALYIQRRRKRIVGGSTGMELRFQTINVPHGINVTYSNRELNFISVENGATDKSMRISGVYFLYTFDATGTVDQFRRSASVDEELLLLPGPGPMYVVGRYAYFQLFVIDPRGLIPNMEEMLVLSNLTEAQIDFASEDEENRLSTDFLNPPTFDPIDIGLPPSNRKKRQVGQESFDDEVVMVALQNENACNPVLRASANALLQQADSTDPLQMEMLRQSLEG